MSGPDKAIDPELNPQQAGQPGSAQGGQAGQGETEQDLQPGAAGGDDTKGESAS